MFHDVREAETVQRADVSYAPRAVNQDLPTQGCAQGQGIVVEDRTGRAGFHSVPGFGFRGRWERGGTPCTNFHFRDAPVEFFARCSNWKDIGRAVLPHFRISPGRRWYPQPLTRRLTASLLRPRNSATCASGRAAEQFFRRAGVQRCFRRHRSGILFRTGERTLHCGRCA